MRPIKALSNGPDEQHPYGPNLSVRGFPDGLRLRAKAAAALRGLTLGQWMVEAVGDALARGQQEVEDRAELRGGVK